MTYTTKTIGGSQLAWHLDMGGDVTECLLADGWLDNGYKYNFAFACKWEGLEPMVGPEKAEWPIVVMTIMNPAGETKMGFKQYPPEEFKAGHFDVVIGNNTFKGLVTADGLPAGYEVHVDLDGLRLDLTANAVNTGVQFVEDDHGFAIYDGAKNIGHAWWPLVPRASVEANIVFGDERIASHGIGYLEKDIENLDGLAMSDFTSTWYWGHGWTDDYTVTWNLHYGHEAMDWHPFSSVVLWKAGEPIFSSNNLSICPIKFAWDDVTGQARPSLFTIHATEGHFELFGRISNSTVFERHPVLNGPPGEEAGIIIREFGEIDLEVTRLGRVERVKGKAVFENGQITRWIPRPSK